jgi:hypothetical protein
VAGLTLAIPVLIHLFNLRRYKTVFFPHTRFLKNIQLNSRRQSQVRYKWLLAARLLFLAMLILAFAQPFFNRQAKNTGNRLQAIYLDNSYSMSAKSGARTLLDVAKEKALQQVKSAVPGSRFILLTNDKPAAYEPQPADKIISEIGAVEVSPAIKTTDQVLSAIHGLMQNNNLQAADVYYYSDFQHSQAEMPAASAWNNIHFYGMPVQAKDAGNIYIDTAYLNAPVLQTRQNNELVVHTINTGAAPKEPVVLQLAINGQVKSAASINFNEKKESFDTINFQVNDASWQQMALTVNDASVHFDDTFRIAARSSSNLSVLVLNQGQANPYILAAFRSYNGFKLEQQDVAAAPKDFKEYNLVILNGITQIDNQLGQKIAAALQQGQSICIFPGKTANINALNEGLKQVGDIHITNVDTAVQSVSSLQQGSTLVKDIFEHIPENIQLPVVKWHYTIESGLSANRQSVLSFRNGDPYLASFTPSKGQLYILASSADLEAGNFAGSYFFLPFIYQMAAQSRNGDIYAVNAGSKQPVYLSFSNASERNMVHLYGKGMEVIPQQQPSGTGLNVYLDQATHTAGFYTLAAAGSDSIMVALNANRAESKAGVWALADLKNSWKGDNIHWVDINNETAANAAGSGGNFPLWKLCVILALLMLAAETLLLAGGFRKQNIATQ